jgi:hypothetical protein
MQRHTVKYFVRACVTAAAASAAATAAVDLVIQLRTGLYLIACDAPLSDRPCGEPLSISLVKYMKTNSRIIEPETAATTVAYLFLDTVYKSSEGISYSENNLYAVISIDASVTQVLEEKTVQREHEESKCLVSHTFLNKILSKESATAEVFYNYELAFDFFALLIIFQ